MKVNYEKAIVVNDEVKLKIDEHQVDITRLKAHCDIDDED